jgi:HlyD family secretion protein
MSTELDRELNETVREMPADDDFPAPSRGRSRRVVRSLVWAAALIVIAGVIGLVYYRRSHAAPVVHYETADVDRGTIAAKITATGSLSALLTVQVGSQVSGRVQYLYVDYNSAVTKGETIAKLDPVLFEAALAQARANLLSGEGVLKKDQAQEINMQAIYNRTKALQEAGVSAQSDLDTASANYDAAKAQIEADQSNLESARALLNQAQVNLDYTTIISPIDGTVISRSVDVGQTVAASFQAPTLFVIAQDLRHMQVDTNVGEADVGRLSAGMTATFTVDAFPNREFTGKLRQIRNSAQTLQNVVTYDAVIDVENPNLLLRPSMTANTSFVAAQKDNVVRLRNAALRFEPEPQLLARIGIKDAPLQPSVPPDPNRKKVWILRDGKPVSVTVSTGVTDGTWSELVQGDVRPGDVLITDMSVNPRGGLL